MSKKQKAAILTSALAVLTAFGVAVAGLTDSPAALLEGDKPAAVVEYRVPGKPVEESPEAEQEDSEESKKRRGFRERWQKRLLALPLGVRLTVLLPLWLLGTGVSLLASALFGVLSPLLGKVLGGVLVAALLVGLFLLGAKTAFPDLPIRKILNRRTVPKLLIGAVLLVLLDLLLGRFWPGYGDWKSLLGSIGLLLTLGAVLIPFALKEHRRRKDLAPKEKPKEESILHFTDGAGNEFSIRRPTI